MKMSKPRHISDVRALARRALAAGGTIARPYVVEWGIAGRCSNPVTITVAGRPPPDMVLQVDPWGKARYRNGKQRLQAPLDPMWGVTVEVPMWVDMEVKCRKCANCLRARAREWAMRAQSETSQAQRTWFGTLTLRPEEHHRAENLARKRISVRAGLDYDLFSQEEQFRERVNQITPEVTLWLKRIRKNSGAKLRYILVAEAHKTGLPHLHILVHEVAEGGAVKHKELTSQWKLGFSKFNLVAEDKRPAWYVCKYLSKSAMARVRASVRYGKTP